jgi:hypothetical protein
MIVAAKRLSGLCRVFRIFREGKGHIFPGNETEIRRESFCGRRKLWSHNDNEVMLFWELGTGIKDF